MVKTTQRTLIRIKSAMAAEELVIIVSVFNDSSKQVCNMGYLQAEQVMRQKKKSAMLSITSFSYVK